MPFIRRNFAPMGETSQRMPAGAGEATGFGAPLIWTYRTQDATATVDTAGYFNDVASLLRAGDVIYRVTINSSGVPQTHGWHVVNDISAAGVVDVTDTTAIATTDTD